AYGPQNDVTLKMPAFEWVHVQLHQQKGMISLSPPTICNSARRGMHGLRMITSDDHSGLRAAIDAVFPGILWQRCQFHLQQNAHSYVTKKDEIPLIAADIRKVFNRNMSR
uniref:transposase n=1 Tax=Escherichia coli TaxID=562 RepID=UPI001BC8F35D